MIDKYDSWEKVNGAHQVLCRLNIMLHDQQKPSKHSEEERLFNVQLNEMRKMFIQVHNRKLDLLLRDLKQKR